MLAPFFIFWGIQNAERLMINFTYLKKELTFKNFIFILFIMGTLTVSFFALNLIFSATDLVVLAMLAIAYALVGERIMIWAKKKTRHISDGALPNMGYALVAVSAFLVAGIVAIFDNISLSNRLLAVAGYAFGILILNCILKKVLYEFLDRSGKREQSRNDKLEKRMVKLHQENEEYSEQNILEVGLRHEEQRKKGEVQPNRPDLSRE